MRKDLADYSGSVHCAIVGHCIAVAEQRKILEKAKYNEKNLSDADCHEILTVELAKKDSPLKIRIEKFLLSKYKRELEYWDDLLDVEYKRELNIKAEEENFGGHIYALLKQTDIPQSDIYQITGLIHIAAFNKVNNYEKQNNSGTNLTESLSLQIKEQKSINSKLKNEIYILKKDNTNLLKTTKKLEEENKELKSDFISIDRLKDEKEILKEKIVRLFNRVTDLENTIEKNKEKEKILEIEILTQSKIIEEQKNQLEKLSENYGQDDYLCENCINKDLCGKRILVVGGLSKMKSYYRSSVEDLGGIFEHNDGYLKNGDLGLKESIKKADYILCPVDVNSHNACLSVKLYCKKYNKPFFMLKNSGLSSISRKVNEIANLTN